MRIISRKPINDFAEIHPECEAGLSHWYREMKKGKFSNIQEVRSVFSHADKDGKFTTEFETAAEGAGRREENYRKSQAPFRINLLEGSTNSSEGTKIALPAAPGGE